MTLPSVSPSEETEAAVVLPSKKISQRPFFRALIWLGVVGFVVLLGWLLGDYEGGFYQLPLGAWVNTGVEWLIVNWAVFFDIIKNVTAAVLNSLEKFLLWRPWWSVLVLMILLAWRVAGRRVGIFAGAAMHFIGILGH